MKKTIEKAIENGFDISIIIKETGDYNIVGVEVLMDVVEVYYETELNVFYNENPCLAQCNIYKLIFGTDFIDKLVGCCDEICINKTCGYHNEEEAEDNCIGEVACESALATCKKAIRINPIDHHRSKLSNLKDITKIKEYVNNLVEGK